ncbi:MAG: serine hydrolase [Bacteroidetes bacterium]|nr:serine hydrolase [Bacteroidota bacterium]
MHKYIKYLVPLLLLFVSFTANDNANHPVLSTINDRWVDSVFSKLTPDERIAQLFMVAAYSNKDKKHEEEILKLVKDQKIGGLIFFQGGPVRQAILTNKYQKAAKVPLLISIDGEWGLSMRLDSTPRFPRQMALGAIQNDTLIYQMGQEIAYECKRLGIHINFAPDADVNNNPLNPVIGSRSFGENKENVANKSIAYMKGMQDNHILATGKHFPGHGDTDSDSHKTLPVINQSAERIDSLELYPFKKLIEQGLGSIMVAHLFVPSLDSTANKASTLSKYIVTDLLKNKLNFKGLIFTDALNMKGVSKFYEPGMVDVKALIAGNDVLLFAENVPRAIEEIKKAVERGEITQEEIDMRCKKILAVKKWCGLDKIKPIKLENLTTDLNNRNAELVNRKLAEASVTILKNKSELIPLKNLDTLRIAAISIDNGQTNVFQNVLKNYAKVDLFAIDKDARKENYDSLLSKLKKYNTFIVNFSSVSNSPKKDFGLTPQTEYLLKVLRQQRMGRVVLNIFANSYILGKFNEAEKVDALLMSYEDTYYMQDASAQIIFGGIRANGKLPVSVSDYFKQGDGITSAKSVRLKYTIPEEFGVKELQLARIDSIVLNGIKEHVYPGCQVFIAKEGKVLYNKSFGYHTYENKTPVRNTDVYDLASITKIASSAIAMMSLVEKKGINLDEKLSTYLPELVGTNKQDIILREMLTHQAGLPAWLLFWPKTMSKGEYKKSIYSSTQTDSFPVRVAENLYITRSYSDSIYNAIVKSPLGEKKYKYSDLGYYFLQRIIEKDTQISIDKYNERMFYSPLGLSTLGYKPREKIDVTNIVPTENDTKFRKQLVVGDVHDPGAAMLGGVAGHAGLFSNANDLGILMQMLLQKGDYGGNRYLDSSVVNEFTKCQYCVSNRRGLGFDKPETDSAKDSPVCDCVSYLSYGHTGFTGTMTWVDPASELVYVFLSNRVYPNADENKLAKSGIRNSILKVVYQYLN